MAYVALGLLLWALPLLRVLHVESAAAVAGVSFFVAGLSALALFRRRWSVTRAVLVQQAALVIPWAFLTMTVFWAPNCGYFQGLLFFGIFPVVSVFLAVALARLLHVLPLRRRGVFFVVIGVAVAVFPPLFDVALHPQFYTYNHVFGGVLGPIYDEELAVRPGLFAFRGLSILWGILFLLFARWLNSPGRWLDPRGRPLESRGQRLDPRGRRLGSRGRPWLVAACLVTAGLIVGAYASAPRLGFNTPEWLVRERLGAVYRTEHFDIYYDDARLDASALRLIAHEHEFQYARLASKLDLIFSERIQSYVYPDPDVKSSLTGARYTSVAPVWLRTPQMHLLQSDFYRVFPHELAHVFSRKFGLPGLRASLSTGLVEGFAVAVEPPDGRPNPDELVAAGLYVGSLGREVYGGDETPVGQLRSAVVSHLSPFGFWTGRGAVSYTAMGSFVRFLIDAYGLERFKAVYPRANFRRVYGKPVEVLVDEWTDRILSLPVMDRSAAGLAAARFSVPSIFEKDCPHYVPAYRRLHRAAVAALARADSAEAFHLAEASVARESAFVPGLELWARLALARGMEEEVFERVEPVVAASPIAALLTHLGDALALLGRTSDAVEAYERAARRLPAFAHEDASLLDLRILLAGRPEVIRIVVGSDSPPYPIPGSALPSPSASVDPVPSSPAGSGAPSDPVEEAARLAFALAHARAENFELAFESLRTSSTRAIRQAERSIGSRLERRRLTWLARFAYRTGDLEASAAYADEAAAAYQRLGAIGEARTLEEFRRKVEWLTETNTLQVARASGG